MTKVSVSRITIFPIKSLDGVSVSSSVVLDSGALEFDRELALCDRDGTWVNGKRDPRIHLIRAEYDLEIGSVRLQSPASFPDWHKFELRGERKEMEEWFSDYLEMHVVVQENRLSGFPDDTHALGPTIISTGTLSELDRWFGFDDLEETRRRLRTNIELDVLIPFWEDRLFGSQQDPPEFRIGEAGFLGSGPCKRCVVPTRNSLTGESAARFAETLSSRRKETLPPWATLDRFGSFFYRVAVNTQPPKKVTRACVAVGDLLTQKSEESRREERFAER